MEVTSQATIKKDANEKCKKYARAGTVTPINVLKKGARSSGRETLIVGSAEPFCEQRVNDMARSARESAEPRKYRQGGKKTDLQGFYYSRVVRSNEVVNCAVLIEMNLTAREMLSHKAVNWKLKELRKQERRDREELRSKSE